jgi:hypothetical protein
VLDGLAAAGGGAEGDGASDEEDELIGGGVLEVAKVANVRGVCQHDGLLLLPTTGCGGGGKGGTTGEFEDQQRRDLHRSSAGGIRARAGARWGWRLLDVVGNGRWQGTRVVGCLSRRRQGVGGVAGGTRDSGERWPRWIQRSEEEEEARGA